jgi:hypothetical protein
MPQWLKMVGRGRELRKRKVAKKIFISFNLPFYGFPLSKVVDKEATDLGAAQAQL